MSSIVCATRGGEGSRVVQMAAIELAKNSGRKLFFLYVTDPDSMGHVDAFLKTAVRDELRWLGETLLRTAQRRADAAHIASEVVIREGHVDEEIIRFLKQSNAELLLMGAPRGTTANVFGDDRIEQVAGAIQEAAQTEVRIVRPEAGTKAARI